MKAYNRRTDTRIHILLKSIGRLGPALRTILLSLFVGGATGVLNGIAQPGVGPSVVTNLSQASLAAAIHLGLPLTFGVNGVIPLTNTIVITRDTTIDGTRRSITLDGQNAVRHFVVSNGITLRLINLRLISGRAEGIKRRPSRICSCACKPMEPRIRTSQRPFKVVLKL
jgi:hypothetical protein